MGRLTLHGNLTFLRDNEIRVRHVELGHDVPWRRDGNDVVIDDVYMPYATIQHVIVPYALRKDNE